MFDERISAFGTCLPGHELAERTLRESPSKDYVNAYSESPHATPFKSTWAQKRDNPSA